MNNRAIAIVLQALQDLSVIAVKLCLVALCWYIIFVSFASAYQAWPKG